MTRSVVVKLQLGNGGRTAATMTYSERGATGLEDGGGPPFLAGRG